MRLISIGDTWIFQDNLAPFLSFAADLTKYHISPDEIQIIDSAVRETDQERNRWYDYELTGDSTVSLSFAIDPGSSVVFWRAKCPAEMQSAIEAVTNLMQQYRFVRTSA